MTLTSDDLREIGKLFDSKLGSVATKKDLESVATKKDLTPFATKEDLIPFATKQDLKPFATKQDLKPFATKQDIKNLVAGNNRILGTIFKVELALTAREIIKVIMVLNQKMEHQEKRINHLEEHTEPAKN